MHFLLGRNENIFDFFFFRNFGYIKAFISTSSGAKITLQDKDILLICDQRKTVLSLLNTVILFGKYYIDKCKKKKMWTNWEKNNFFSIWLVYVCQHYSQKLTSFLKYGRYLFCAFTIVLQF